MSRKSDNQDTRHVACELPIEIARALKIEAAKRDITQRELIKEIITSAVLVHGASLFGDTEYHPS